MKNEIRTEDLYPDYVIPYNVPPIKYPYIVVGYYLVDGHWAVFKEMFETQEAALKYGQGKGNLWRVYIYCLKVKEVI